MVSPFIFQNRTKVYFGNGMLFRLHEELARRGRRVLLVYGSGSIKKNGIYPIILHEIEQAGFSGYELSGVTANPDIRLVRQGVSLCRRAAIDLILAVGGGSVLDTAKAIAGSVPYEDDPWDLIKSRAQIREALPVIAVPTLASTGSEMNGCAVISNGDTREKCGWTAEPLRPSVSFLCPENTYSADAYQTACGSADILSHLLEVYLQKEKTFDAVEEFMESMMRSVIKYAPMAMENPECEEARANLLWNASWAINDFVESGHSVAWSCHAMEHELSAFYRITHGLGLAILTPAFLSHVLNEETAPRLARFAVNVMGVKPKKSLKKTAEKGIRKLSGFFCKTLGLPGTLSQIGIDSSDFEKMADQCLAWKGKNGVIHGFIPLEKKDILEIYRKAL